MRGLEEWVGQSQPKGGLRLSQGSEVTYAGHTRVACVRTQPFHWAVGGEEDSLVCLVVAVNY